MESHLVLLLEQLCLLSGEQVVADDEHLAVAEVVLARGDDRDVIGVQPGDPPEGLKLEICIQGDKSTRGHRLC